MPTVDLIVASVALGFAVFAYMGIREHRKNFDYWTRLEQESHHRIQADLERLEKRVVKVEAVFLTPVEDGSSAGIVPLSSDLWPEVIHTTSEKRPEVREVEGED